MSYRLGVDLGTTYTAAAVHKAGRSEVFELGTRSATIPSVVFIQDDGTILAGEAANRRALREPNRVARQFKRRVGDPTPMLIGGSPYAAEAISAKLLRWVIETVAEREGSLPSQIALTHPANWGTYKLDLLQQALVLESIEGVSLLPEPEAAAIEYASFERTEPGSVVAVFDLGGGTFDASLLRKSNDGFEILGRPEGIERLGGVDFDEAVFGFVAQFLGDALTELDRTDPVTQAAVARLRSECVEAKEALSFDTKVSIPVVLPTVHTEVRLTRSEFEDLIRPSLLNAVLAMKRAVVGANLTVDDVDVVLLVGGSSRIPLIGQMVASDLGRPVAVDAHPKHLVALGASRPGVAQPKVAVAVPPPPPELELGPEPAPTVSPEPEPEQPVADGEVDDDHDEVVAHWAAGVPQAPAVSSAPVDRPEAPIRSVDTSVPPKPRRRVLVLAASVVLVAAVGLGLALTRGGDSSQAATTSTTAAPNDSSSTTTSTDATSTTTSSTTTTSQAGPESAGETSLLNADSTSTTASDQTTTATTDRTKTSNSVPSVVNTEPTSAPTVPVTIDQTTPDVTEQATPEVTEPTTPPLTEPTTEPTDPNVTETSPPTTQPQQAFVPGVAGITGQQAVQRIVAAGLTTSCGQRCSDLVRSTSPAAGTALAPGTFVQLNFS